MNFLIWCMLWWSMKRLESHQRHAFNAPLTLHPQRARFNGGLLGWQCDGEFFFFQKEQKIICGEDKVLFLAKTPLITNSFLPCPPWKFEFPPPPLCPCRPPFFAMRVTFIKSAEAILKISKINWILLGDKSSPECTSQDYYCIFMLKFVMNAVSPSFVRSIYRNLLVLSLSSLWLSPAFVWLDKKSIRTSDTHRAAAPVRSGKQSPFATSHRKKPLHLHVSYQRSHWESYGLKLL